MGQSLDETDLGLRFELSQRALGLEMESGQEGKLRYLVVRRSGVPSHLCHHARFRWLAEDPTVTATIHPPPESGEAPYAIGESRPGYALEDSQLVDLVVQELTRAFWRRIVPGDGNGGHRSKAEFPPNGLQT
jgi:hypothetical protein